MHCTLYHLNSLITIAAQYSVSHDDLLDANKERNVDLTAGHDPGHTFTA